jgi:hypothetical protein
MATLNITPAVYRRLKNAYEKAANEKQETFDFEGVQFVTRYAFYLLEHLRSRFERSQ